MTLSIILIILDCLYYSDGNSPPKAKEDGRFHFEEAILALSDGLSIPVLGTEKIVIIEELGMKRTKVGTLKIELRNRGLSIRWKKAELSDKSKYVMVNIFPMI